MERIPLLSHLKPKHTFSNFTPPPPPPPAQKKSDITFSQKKKKLHGHISLSPKECHLTSCIWDRISLSLPLKKRERACWRVHVRDVLERPPPHRLAGLYSPTCPLDPERTAGEDRRTPIIPPPLLLLLPPSTANYDSITINRSCYQIKEICTSGNLFLFYFFYYSLFVFILTFLANLWMPHSSPPLNR